MVTIVKLANYVSGQWVEGSDEGTPLVNPVTGETLATASSTGVDLQAALEYARDTGGKALRSLTYQQRGELLGKITAMLAENAAKYYQLAAANSGNTPVDAAIDVDGGIGTIKYFAALGASLGDRHFIAEPGLERLTRDKNFQACHIQTPLKGVAIHINAFNFPSWGLWEKASVALLAGVPAFIKPATATSMLTQAMIKDVVAAEILPAGSLSVICGGGHNLLDFVQPSDVVFFTGSAKTACKLKANPKVVETGVRFNVEADSLNMSMLGADVEPGSPLFQAFIKETAREMTTKAGQKCTAIRRIFVPASNADAVAEALSGRLEKITMGNPQAEGVRMGPLVNKAQQEAAKQGLAKLKGEAVVIFGGSESFDLVDANAEDACFVQPTLLRCDNPNAAERVHDTEVFGPAATILPYQSEQEAFELAGKGGGSLAGSIFTNDDDFATRACVELSSCHGRLLVVDESIMESHSGHGIVMPQCVHGGPGRAGGGEELGGLRALNAYHQRTAVQANMARVTALQD